MSGSPQWANSVTKAASRDGACPFW